MSTLYSALLILCMPASSPFTIEEALTQATANHPALEAAAYAVEEETYEAQQAGLLPNPELEIGVEAWRPNSSNDEGVTWMFGVSQLLPLSGTRRLAKKSGMIGAEAAQQESEGIRLEVEGYASDLFYRALAAQERTAILEDISSGATALAALTRIRFEQGDVPEMDVIRIEAEKNRYEVDLESARKERDAIRAQLAELCGIEANELPECTGEIAPTLDMLPDREVLRTLLAASPLNVARSLRVEQARTALVATRRSALPEPTLYAGFRRETAADANSIDLGISIPLPLFDRKQGSIAAARVREKRIEAENEATSRNELRSCLELHAKIEAEIAVAEKLRNTVIPQLTEVNAIVEKAQELGGVTVFETLIARRDIAETRLALLESESNARTALIALPVILEQ